VINEHYFLSLDSQGARAVLRYLEHVEARIADAEARVTRSQQSLVSRLSKELARAKATLAIKSARLVEQQQLNHRLTLRIRELEREVESRTSVARDSHNSSLPPSSDPPWQKVPRTRSLRRKSGLKVGGQPGHPGATLKRSETADQLITHAPAAGPGCGASLREAEVVSSDSRQVFDLPGVRLSVTEHCRETRRCRACGTQARSDFPASVRAPVQYGPALLARAAYLNLYQLLPVARTSEAIGGLFGCALSPATI
jgi:transposase